MPPLARSSMEAHLYMSLRPCICGERDFEPSGAVDWVDGVWLVRYTGICQGCGQVRVFEFRQPDDPVMPDEGQFSVGDGASELLDAGEWLRVADELAAEPADPAELSADDRDARRTRLLAAAGAVDEVLRFIPPGAAEVPDTAFWSIRGRAVRIDEPGRFQRTRLEYARDTYRWLAGGGAS